jgi:hypothetical protein
MPDGWRCLEKDTLDNDTTTHMPGTAGHDGIADMGL